MGGDGVQRLGANDIHRHFLSYPILLKEAVKWLQKKRLQRKKQQRRRSSFRKKKKRDGGYAFVPFFLGGAA
jgi:hypothetical protein